MSVPSRPATTTVAATDLDERKSVVTVLRDWAFSNWIVFALVLLCLYFSVESSAFATVFNIRNVLNDASLLLVMAVGQTYIMIAGGIDLSVGSVLVFSGVVAAKLMGLNAGIGQGHAKGPVGITIAIIVAILAGGVWGAINGFLVGKVKLPPLIVTLGTLGMAFGAAQLITGGTDLSGVNANLVKHVGQGIVWGVPVLVIIAVVVAAIGGAFLAWSRFGTHTYAVGSNAEAARRVAISVERHLIKVYTLQGLLAGLVGVLSLTRFTTTTITSHGQDELAVIAGVVLGGTSLYGGYGSVLKTVVGILIPAVLANGLVILGVQSFWQTFVTGAVLIGAVYFDTLKRRSRSRGS